MSLLAAWIAIPFALAAQSAPVDMTVKAPPELVYKPFDAMPKGEEMLLSFENGGDAPFDGRIEILPSDEAEFGWRVGRHMPATASDEGSGKGTHSLSAPLTIPPSNRVDRKIRWSLDNRWFALPGEYEFPVDIRLYDRSSDALVDEELRVPVRLVVARDHALTIAGTSGSVNADRTYAFIDLGELDSGETAFILMNARANTPVSFEVESANGGHLLSSARPDHRIAYETFFDNERLHLSQPARIARQPDPTLDGSNFRMDFVVGQIEGAFSGEYSDTITVNIIAE